MSFFDQQRWYQLYQEAVLELNPEHLSGKIRAAQIAISTRLQELPEQGPEGREERHRLDDALRNLEIVSREVEFQPPETPQAPDSVSARYVALVNRERQYVEVSDGICDLLGYARHELIGKRIDDVAAPELKDGVPDTFEVNLQNGARDGEFVLLRKDGERIPIHFESWVSPDGGIITRWFPKKRAA